LAGAGEHAAGGCRDSASTVAGVQRRDVLGTTHHEAGTLWMGDDSNSSVTDSNARFHDVANA
jgi:choline dehydrogenase-like flavoprotein